MTDAQSLIRIERPPSRGSDVFSQINRRPTLSEEVLRRFVDVLNTGEIVPGDKLPPERELASLLGISRPAVREALRALSLLGIIDAQPGRGTHIVESLDRLPLEPYILKLLLNRGRLLDLMEIRKINEPEVAALAAQRGTEEDLMNLRAVYAEHVCLVADTEDIAVDAQAGRGFHLALARACGNETLARLLDSLSDLLSQTGMLIVSRRHGASLEPHLAILEAVERRDAAEARRLMQEHLAHVESDLQESLKQVDRDHTVIVQGGSV